MEMNYKSYDTPVGKYDCTSIYAEEMNNAINALKNHFEVWERQPFSGAHENELFKYANSDFYSLRSIIYRQEQDSIPMLTRILNKIMQRYNISFMIPNDTSIYPFVFIIYEKSRKTGIRFSDYFKDELEARRFNKTLKRLKLDEVLIIRTWENEQAEKWIDDENKGYLDAGLKLRAISLGKFFVNYFGLEEYQSFKYALEKYLAEAQTVIGFSTIKFLSNENLYMQKKAEVNELMKTDYFNYRYQIIDNENEEVNNYLYLSDFCFPDSTLVKMISSYLGSSLYKSLLGKNDYAECFITSEWLFHSLENKSNFDYTSIVSGYLKSIEQLLHKIVILNIDNNCKITLENKTIKEADENKIKVYKYRKVGQQYEFLNISNVYSDVEEKYIYIDLTEDNLDYICTSLGAYVKFLRINPHIFIDQDIANNVADMVTCFRIECRNDYFHTHNLKDWAIVKKIRANALYLYFVLLGSCSAALLKRQELGILIKDKFDDLCIKIREFSRLSIDFIFELPDGSKEPFVYDFYKNTFNCIESGQEHYEYLIFYKVEDFSLQSLEKLNSGIKEEQKYYLSRDNLPKRIYGVHRTGESQEITV